MEIYRREKNWGVSRTLKTRFTNCVKFNFEKVFAIVSHSRTNTVISDRLVYPSRHRASKTVIRSIQLSSSYKDSSFTQKHVYEETNELKLPRGP